MSAADETGDRGPDPSPTTPWGIDPEEHTAAGDGDGHDDDDDGEDWDAGTFDEAGDAGVDELFAGDRGALPVPARRALVVLLKNRFVSHRTHPEAYAAVVAHRAQLTSRLHEMFLDLTVDTARHVAFKHNPPSDGTRVYPTLLHDKAFTREQTMVLVYLRSQYRSQQAADGDRVFVDRADIHDFVAQLRPPTATDETGDRKRVNNSIGQLCSASLLLGHSEGDRFEVPAAIEVLMPLTKLRELLAHLTTTTSDTTTSPDTTPDAGGIADAPEAPGDGQFNFDEEGPR